MMFIVHKVYIAADHVPTQRNLQFLYLHTQHSPELGSEQSLAIMTKQNLCFTEEVTNALIHLWT